MRQLIAIGLISTTIFACSGNDDPTTSAYWVDRLEKKTERIEAIKQLGKIGDPSSLPHLTKWFEEKGLWQPDAAYALGLLKDTSVVPTLVAGIDYTVGTGTDKRTRARNRTNLNIAKSLARLQAKDSAEDLVRLLTAPDLATREGVMRALGKLRNPVAAKPLIKIASTETQPFLRKVAIQALGDLGSAEAIPTLINNLYHELPGVSFYFEARHSLLQIGSSAAPALVKTLQRNNKEVEAIRLPSGGGIAEGAIEGKAAFVLGALQATDTIPMLINAMNKYHRLYKNRTRVPVFASVPAAVAEIVYSLGTMGDAAAVPALLTMLKEDTPIIRIAAADALANIGSTKAVPTLLKYATTGEASAQAAVISAISMLASGDQLEAFTALGKGSDEAAKQRASLVNQYRGRLEAAKACQSNALCWKQKLSDSNSDIRERAARQLGWAGDKSIPADLLKAAEDDDAQVRIAAINALSHIGGADVTKLQAIHDAWAKKIEYKDANQNLKRLIAVLQTQP